MLLPLHRLLSSWHLNLGHSGDPELPKFRMRESQCRTAGKLARNLLSWLDGSQPVPSAYADWWSDDLGWFGCCWVLATLPLAVCQVLASCSLAVSWSARFSFLLGPCVPSAGCLNVLVSKLDPDGSRVVHWCWKPGHCDGGQSWHDAFDQPEMVLLVHLHCACAG